MKSLDTAELLAELASAQAKILERDYAIHSLRAEYLSLFDTACDLARAAGASRHGIDFLATSATFRADANYSAVGLDISAPDFLLIAARTAFRRAYHPDGKDIAEKAAAEVAFKHYDSIFEAIMQQRNQLRHPSTERS